MINRIYIDNYKCFVNFECQPQSLQLLLGDNGSGKTAVFDVLETLRDFLCVGLDTATAFPTSTLTAWETRTDQTFELGLQGNGGQYHYLLFLGHDRKYNRIRIKQEQLTFDGKRLYEFHGMNGFLYRDDSFLEVQFPFDPSRSAIPTIPERPDNQLLSWFRNRLKKVYVFSPDPLGMTARSEHELEKPDRQLHDLVSWLRHLSQESVDLMSRLRDHLRDEVIEGLTNMKLEKISDVTRVLKFEFRFDSNGKGKAFELSFDELSTGQQNLVALFAILHAAIGKDTTVCIDEPDNFVALRELQPWLTFLRDRVEDEEGQCLLISHHPELINYLAAQHGLLFHREDSGPARVKPFEWQGDLLPPAEVLARGWK